MLMRNYHLGINAHRVWGPSYQWIYDPQTCYKVMKYMKREPLATHEIMSQWISRNLYISISTFNDYQQMSMIQQ